MPMQILINEITESLNIGMLAFGSAYIMIQYLPMMDSIRIRVFCIQAFRRVSLFV